MCKTKVCSKCKADKSVADFSKDKSRRDGLQCRCKACYRAKYTANSERAKAHNAAWKATNSQRVKTSNAAWMAANPQACSNQRARRRAAVAAVLSIPFTEAQWSAKVDAFEHKCCYCDKPGTVLTLTRDHLVPISKGGADTYENIVPCCKACNSSKHARILYDQWVPSHSRHLYPNRYA